MSSIKMYGGSPAQKTGQPKVIQTRFFNVARTDITTGVAKAKLPKGARILGFLLNGVASDAATTATLSIGSSTTATEYVSGADVKTAAAGVGPTWLAGVSGAFGTAPLTADVVIYALYAETGTASTVGNWTVAILHTLGETAR